MATRPLVGIGSSKGLTSQGKSGGASKTRAPAGHGATRRPSKRLAGATERRAAIIAAGLEEFTAKGFAATRLEDVAKRAGVAKGTIYLHFKDKEALFQDLVRTALGPLAALIANPAIGPDTGSARAAMEALAATFAREVVGTKRGDILRLVISEGTRFPSLAEFYYREVVAHGVAGMRRLIEYGIARGEIRNRGLAEFPQLVLSPLVVAVIWQGLFGKHAALDVEAMLRVHLGVIFDEGKAA